MDVAPCRYATRRSRTSSTVSAFTMLSSPGPGSSAPAAVLLPETTVAGCRSGSVRVASLSQLCQPIGRFTTIVAVDKKTGATRMRETDFHTGEGHGFDR